ncbi:MAG TPA: SMC-Scp complex subunit ScpB [Alphaproteobacteria bacterium]|nr:SMC-Scp complex subunit ScpB [Alphaproteobacteria bacterium]
MNDRQQQLRLIEALLFASAEPLDEQDLRDHLPEGADLLGLIRELGELYANRGVHLVEVGKRWAFRTAPDLAAYLRTEKAVARKLNRPAIETLAIVAYHQPVTRPEIEEIRGVSLSPGTLDVLVEAGWVKPGRRKNTPGRPLTWVTTDAFLDHFGLASVKDLPGIEELRAAGLLDKRPAIAAYGAALGEDQLAEQEDARETELEEAEAAEELALDPLEDLEDLIERERVGGDPAEESVPEAGPATDEDAPKKGAHAADEAPAFEDSGEKPA